MFDTQDAQSPLFSPQRADCETLFQAKRDSRRCGKKARARAEKNRTDILVALNSDGTVFDSVDLKHRQGFAPLFPFFFGEPGLGDEGARLMRELWLRAALGPRFRGAGRYNLLYAALRLCAAEPGLGRRLKSAGRGADSLAAWLAQESAPSGPRLLSALAAGGAAPILAKVLDWSAAADRALAGLPRPKVFQGAALCIPRIAKAARLIVLDALPGPELVEEWIDAGFFPYARRIAGEEEGLAASILRQERRASPMPIPSLLIGDSRLDLKTARLAGSAFYPILPGAEEKSWKEFLDTFFPAFIEERSPRAPLAAFLQERTR